ncbi:MAG: ADP-ribosylglycohydrolase family protein [Candidatus Bathyarchaeia archaeon]
MKGKKLYDKILGSIAGAAIGDSMGSTVEFLHHKAISKYYGKIEDLTFSSGKFTDDTSLRLLVYSAIINKGGRITAYDLASYWIKNVIPNSKYWITELFISAELYMGKSPREAGFYNLHANDAAMLMDPIGVVNCSNPRNSAVDAYDVGSVCQSGAELEASMAVAAAVAEAFKVNTSPKNVVEMACCYSSPIIESRVKKAIKIVESCKSLSEIYDRLYEEIALEDGSDRIVKNWRYEDIKKRSLKIEDISLGVSALEAVPVALAFFYLFNGDPLKTIIACVNYGRDSDTIAGIGGAIAGAFMGANSIDYKFIEQVNRANNISLQSFAERMIEPVINTLKEQKESIQFAEKLL